MPSRDSFVVTAGLLLASCAGGAALPPAPVGAARDGDMGASDQGPRGSSSEASSRYDAVGRASWYGDELAGRPTASGAPFMPDAFTAAHRTLPLGSVAEVTALDGGRNILVLINDRGPSREAMLIDLSRGAAQALGIDAAPGAAVRVRRVTPSAADVAALNAGRPAASRLPAPAVILAALRAQLPATARDPARGVPPGAPRKPPRGHAAPPVAADGRYVVQVAAFSGEDRARALAASLRGSVHAAGALWRVWLGPYRSLPEAQRARDGAATRGYADARIITP